TPERPRPRAVPLRRHAAAPPSGKGPERAWPSGVLGAAGVRWRSRPAFEERVAPADTAGHWHSPPRVLVLSGVPMLSRAMCAAYVLGWSTRAGRVLCTIFLIGMSFAACGEGAADRTVARGGAPVLGGTLVVASAIDLEHANPLITTEGVTHDVLRSLLYMTLVRHGRDNGYEPWLAESWELEGDTGIVFHIRRDVRWHDGLPTTAHDVEFTYRLAKAPETGYPNASLFERWGEVEVLDSFTVRFRFEPHPDPLVGWPDFPILPRHHLAETWPAALRQAGFNRSPVGNGPFR